jgi:hypothetical protein
MLFPGFIPAMCMHPDFKLGNLNSNSNRNSMHARVVFSHHIIGVETVCMSLKLYMINYSRKYVKENTSPNCRELFFQ